MPRKKLAQLTIFDARGSEPMVVVMDVGLFHEAVEAEKAKQPNSSKTNSTEKEEPL